MASRSMADLAGQAFCLVLCGGTALAQCELLDLAGPSVWTEGSQHGFSVDFDGDRMAVGQTYGPYSFDPPMSAPGMVYLYRHQPWGWVADGIVQSLDGESSDQFGSSVALDGDTLLVGAVAMDPLGAKGAAYVFERLGDGLWVQTAKLVPNQPQAWAIGWSVALEGDTAIVGAKGASLGLGWGYVFVFERIASVWTETQQILPSFSLGGDSFGLSVALQGDRLVVGAPYAFTWGYPGWAFVFEKQAGLWTEAAVLTGADSVDSDYVGYDVALDGDTILVGAPLHDQPNPVNGGAAYVFEFTGGSWTQTAKLWGDPYWFADFGWSLDLDGERMVIGAPFDSEVENDVGAAFTFERVAATWERVSKFMGSGLTADDNFGTAIDLEGEELLIGAPNIAPGSVHLFSFLPGPHLLGDAGSVSLSQGSAQTFSLGAGTEHAGDLFFLAGSATGTSPGFTFGALLVPLNPDFYFFHTVNNPGAPPLLGSLGFLDALGRGEASFAPPPGSPPALTGLVLNHAYALLDAVTLALEGVSPAVGVLLQP